MDREDLRDALAEITRFRTIVDELRKEIQQLRRHVRIDEEIIDKLPRTADGVPVVPGMTLWDPVWPDDPFGVQALLVFCPNARRSEWMCNDGEVDAAQCYSTREAADAARDIPNAS